MSKPIVITVNASTNTVRAKKFLVTSGGYVAELGASGTPKGVAVANKDVNNNVGMIAQGLIKMPAAAATYNPGDVLGGNSSGVIAYSSGVRVGIVAEPQQKIVSTGYSLTDPLLVYLNMDLA